VGSRQRLVLLDFIVSCYLFLFDLLVLFHILELLQNLYTFSIFWCFSYVDEQVVGFYRAGKISVFLPRDTYA